MNKSGKKLCMPLAFAVFILMVTPLIQANAVPSSTPDTVTISSRPLMQKTLLTDSEIKATWPNLPTAQKIYNEGCLVIDLRYCGKRASSMNDDLPDPESPTVIDIESTIVNCTMNIPNYLHGGIMYDRPKIWLKYNSSIWVSVPSKYLTTFTGANSS